MLILTRDGMLIQKGVAVAEGQPQEQRVHFEYEGCGGFSECWLAGNASNIRRRIIGVQEYPLDPVCTNAGQPGCKSDSGLAEKFTDASLSSRGEQP